MTAPRLKGLVTALALVSIAGCDGAPTGPTGPLDDLPRPLTSTEREVVSASDAFGFELFRAGEPRALHLRGEAEVLAIRERFSGTVLFLGKVMDPPAP